MLPRFTRRQTASEEVPSEATGALAAFGKHPAWSDHVDGVGLENDQHLIRFSRALYAAVEANISWWEGLPAESRTAGFAHVFMRRIGVHMVYGRLWSSADSKKRDKYPMVICAHTTLLSLDWGCEHILPVLAQLQSECAGATTQQAVIAAIDARRHEMQQRVRSAPIAARALEADPAALVRMADHEDFAHEPEAIPRVLYHIARSRLDSAEATAEPMRLPRCADSAEQAAAAWLRAMHMVVNPALPILAVAPLEHRWVDVLLGRTGDHSFSCLKDASASMTSETPYVIPQTVYAQYERTMARAREGTLKVPPEQELPWHEGAPERSGGRRKRGILQSLRQRWLPLVLMVLLAPSLTAISTFKAGCGAASAADIEANRTKVAWFSSAERRG